LLQPPSKIEEEDEEEEQVAPAEENHFAMILLLFGLTPNIVRGFLLSLVEVEKEGSVVDFAAFLGAEQSIFSSPTGRF
jgi:hypothetical protein